MSPFEIANAIRTRPDQEEDVQSFARRTMAKERIVDFTAAIELLIGWDRAYEEIEQICNAGAHPSRQRCLMPTLGRLIAAKRDLGYDAQFEALLAHRWRCPHCKQFSTVEKIELPIGDNDRLPRCITCGEEGIAPISNDARLAVRDGGKSGLRPC